MALVAVPLLHIADRAIEAGRNIAYWDEYETALALILRLDRGDSPAAVLGDFFAVNNEHRMVTSRLMFAVSYWLTGTINFSIISLIGNATLLALAVLLVHAATTAERRLRLGVVLVFGIFHLANYENFLWSGSSIDHFQVLLYVGGTVLGLARGTRTALLAAALCALLATLTLAHGLLAWPLGAAMLWLAGRRRTAGAWCALAAVVGAGYLIGFSFNRAHHYAGWTLDGALNVGRYWLTLLGSVPALGHKAVAPWLGALLLVLLGGLAWRRAPQREPVFFALACFGVAALALVAVGRTTEVGGLVMSRYLILGSLAWSLVVFLLIEAASHPARPLRVLLWCLPGLVAFNFASDRAFAADADSWLECRDIAATAYKRDGADGRGLFSLYPEPARSTRILREAEARGIYRLGAVCLRRPFPEAQPSTRIAYSVDELVVSPRSVFVRGWAAIPGNRAERGETHVVLRSATDTVLFTTVNMQRPDVARAHRDQDWHRSGFIFSRRSDRLPAGDYQLGFLIEGDAGNEYVMTPHRLVLSGTDPSRLAGED